MVDPIFNMFKVKFSIMDTLKILDRTKKKVRIYISLEMVLKKLFTINNNNKIQLSVEPTDLRLCLISNIINLAQHYRLYCTKYGMGSEIYIYFNHPIGTYKNGYIISNYRAYYVENILRNDGCQYILAAFNDSITFLKTAYKYVNGVYIMGVDSIESSVIPYIIAESDGDKDNTQDIIISNVKYDLQYVNYGFRVISPYGKNSSVIDSSTVIDRLKDNYNVVSIDMVSPIFVPFILSLLGDKYRNIEKIRGMGLTSIIKLIDEGLMRRLITPETTNITMLSQLVKDEYRNIFERNYQCVDIRLQYGQLTGQEIYNVLQLKEDKYDENTLYMMNEKYFQLHPIMMINTRSEQIDKGAH